MRRSQRYVVIARCRHGLQNSLIALASGVRAESKNGVKRSVAANVQRVARAEVAGKILDRSGHGWIN
jgi:hypothetical protein